MPKKSKEHVIRVLEKIRELRKAKVPEREIQYQLALTPRTWERHIKKIHEEDKEIWQQVARTQLESELIKLKSSFERTFDIMDAEADKAVTTEEKVLACRAKDDARLSIVQLFTDPDFVNKQGEIEDTTKRKMAVPTEKTN